MTNIPKMSNLHKRLPLFQFIEDERCELSVFVSLAGLGVSLINSRPEEVAYCSLSSSPALWQVRTRASHRGGRLLQPQPLPRPVAGKNLRPTRVKCR